MARRTYIPALGFRVLTPLFDALEALTMPLARIAAALKRLAALRPGGRLLDVGCGTGTLLAAFREATPGAVLAGIDADPDVLARAVSKARGAAILRAFADALPFRDGAFDVVVSTLVFHHLPTAVKRGAFAEMKRVAAPGGTILLADFGTPRGLSHRILQVPFRLLDGYGVTADSVEGRLPALAAECGLELAEAERTRSLYGPVSFFRAVKV